MKRIFAALCVIMLLLVQTASMDSPEQCTDLRIGLYFGSAAPETISVGCAEGLNIHLDEARGYRYSFSLVERESTITKTGELDFLINGNLLSSVGEFAIFPAVGHYLTVNGTQYRGFLVIKRMEGSDMTVINVVELESYLYSVVGKEMSPSWNIEALKAQAVCARSYALTHLGRFSQYGFDLCDTQNSQVYQGIKAEADSTRLAVDSTKGKAVYYGGKPVEVFYFSSGGGSTEDVSNVWGSSFPYLKSAADPYEKDSEATRYNWSTTISRSELSDKLAAKGLEIGELLGMEITKTSDAGRVTELVFTGTEGQYTAKLEKTRTILGGDVVYSQKYTFVLDENDVFTFTGNGWGHAVGMSQWGAKAMADSGFGYEDIIKFYFAGVEVF